MKHKKWIFVSLIIAVFIASFSFTPQAQAQGNTPPFESCWGQASVVFAKMGLMGEHASQQENPRAGLYNLAAALYKDGVIEAPTLAALAAWLVSIDPDLSVEACM